MPVSATAHFQVLQPRPGSTYLLAVCQGGGCLYQHEALCYCDTAILLAGQGRAKEWGTHMPWSASFHGCSAQSETKPAGALNSGGEGLSIRLLWQPVQQLGCS